MLETTLPQEQQPPQEVVYIIQQEEKSDTSWIFWLIVIGVLIFGIIYIGNTIQDATNPFKWFGFIGGW